MPDAGLRSRPALVAYVTAAVVIAVDQWTKWLASAELTYRQPVEVTGWFQLLLAHNRGAAFSFLADAGGWQRWFFAAIALGVSGIILVWLSRLPRQRLGLGCALGLVLGGGLGNLWDRLTLGHVVDFISLHYGDWYWPAFNVADSAISVGAVLLVADSLFAGGDGSGTASTRDQSQ